MAAKKSVSKIKSEISEYLRADQIRDTGEKFSILHRGQIVGAASSIAGAMSSAPATGDVTVRGEYTSDGHFWGPGRGRLCAIREGKTWTRV